MVWSLKSTNEARLRPPSNFPTFSKDSAPPQLESSPPPPACEQHDMCTNMWVTAPFCLGRSSTTCPGMCPLSLLVHVVDMETHLSVDFQLWPCTNDHTT